MDETLSEDETLSDLGRDSTGNAGCAGQRRREADGRDTSLKTPAAATARRNSSGSSRGIHHQPQPPPPKKQQASTVQASQNTGNEKEVLEEVLLPVVPFGGNTNVVS